MAHGPCHPRCRPCDHAAHAACVWAGSITARAVECSRVVTTMNRGGNPVIRVVMTRQIYYQQYRCDSTRTTAQPAHDLSPPPRAAVGARTAEVLVARLTARSRVPGGATGRGPAPAASRAAPPPDAGAHAVTLGAARLSLNITSIR